MSYISGISLLKNKALEKSVPYKFENLQSTGRPLDIVTGQENLFFQVENSNSDLNLLTHVCSLHSDQENYLINEHQNYVLDTNGEKINLGDKILHSIRGNKIVLLKDGEQSFAEQQIGLYYVHNPEIGLDAHACQYFLANDKILQSPATYMQNGQIWAGYRMNLDWKEHELQSVQNDFDKIKLEEKLDQMRRTQMQFFINV